MSITEERGVRTSSRVPSPRGTRDEPLRTSAWEAILKVAVEERFNFMQIETVQVKALKALFS